MIPWQTDCHVVSLIPCRWRLHRPSLLSFHKASIITFFTFLNLTAFLLKNSAWRCRSCPSSLPIYALLLGLPRCHGQQKPERTTDGRHEGQGHAMLTDEVQRWPLSTQSPLTGRVCLLSSDESHCVFNPRTAVQLADFSTPSFTDIWGFSGV